MLKITLKLSEAFLLLPPGFINTVNNPNMGQKRGSCRKCIGHREFLGREDVSYLNIRYRLYSTMFLTFGQVQVVLSSFN